MVKFFINRPIFATVLALILVVAGLPRYIYFPLRNIRKSHRRPYKFQLSTRVQMRKQWHRP